MAAVAWDDVSLNPHCTQRTEVHHVQFQRIITDDFPALPYRRRKGELKSVIHWGQRKLLLSEIEFLTLVLREQQELQDGELQSDSSAVPAVDPVRCVVVYAGAAPGTHIQFLSELFPECLFRLYDPAPFTVRESPRIRVHQQFFGEEVARELRASMQLAENARRKMVFICDIRSCDWSTAANEEENEAGVAKDMAAQMAWHDALRPYRSMLKFRLPWAAGLTEYVKGDLYLPIWGPVTTTETRLVTDRDSTARKQYCNTTYENRLFYFNTVLRSAAYPHEVLGEGLDHCYDCTAEVHTLQAYYRLRRDFDEHTQQGRADMHTAISRLSYDISRACAKDRTLLSPNPDPAQRKSVIVERQFIAGQPAYLGLSSPSDTAATNRSSQRRGRGGSGSSKRGAKSNDRGGKQQSSRASPPSAAPSTVNRASPVPAASALAPARQSLPVSPPPISFAAAAAAAAAAAPTSTNPLTASLSSSFTSSSPLVSAISPSRSVPPQRKPLAISAAAPDQPQTQADFNFTLPN